MIDAFVYAPLPTRVIFGSGTLSRLGEEADSLGVRRALVLTTPQQTELAARAATVLGERAAGHFGGAAMHTPSDVTDRAVEIALSLNADATVAIGGGSTTGLGKAIASRLGLPQIVLPTTYAGSEMTPILGETSDGLKTTRRDPSILPEVVIYDVDLTMGLPVSLSVTSGMNAMAHAVEALYAQDRNPAVSALAEQAIRSLGDALPRVVANPDDREARAGALQGAWLAGICLGSVGMAIHHKLCHTLGGAFNLPHAETHTVMLPHSVAYVAQAVPEAMATIERALGATDAATALFGRATAMGAPASLAALGMREADLARAAAQAVQNPYWNPRPLDEAEILALLRRAWSGETPPRRNAG
ncbi:maleylacetate reductase [Mesorhizobium sp. CAU 1732]|uniref:maleylacetate reductase n=1 Tax=Mesorhizobium sp. CAU 1732 TaxID=3140358 RepID=UPI00326160A5